MKTPLKLTCPECEVVTTVWVDAQDSDVSYSGDCGHHVSAFLDGSITISDFIFRRALHEYAVQSDASLAIVLSAMALESEISRLHHKWEYIKRLGDQKHITDLELDAMLRRYPGIREKVNAVARLMHAEGLDHFVKCDPSLRSIVEHRFPSLRIGSLVEDLQTTVFWPRNRILHLGDMRFTKADARRILNIASLGVHAFKELDRVRRETTVV